MTSHPDMVAGEGRFDTRLMQVAGDRIVSKGVQRATGVSVCYLGRWDLALQQWG
jgi:L-asparaginase II